MTAKQEPQRPSERPRTDPQHLLLRSSGRTVPVGETDSPVVLRLLTDDTCWQIAVQDWQGRRPHLRRAARIAWRQEGRELDAERARLREVAAVALTG
jgi:hypothetical protein